MANLIRCLAIGAGLVYAVLTIGFIWRIPWATYIWPFELLETRLGFIFLGSITIAIALPAIWTGVTGELRAMAPGATNLAVTFAGMAVFLFGQAGADSRPELSVAAVACGVTAVILVGLFLVTRRVPWRDARPMPKPVRVSFVFNSVILVLIGSSLVLAQGWSGPREAQAAALSLLLDGEQDVVIATASGKTEAAFMPLLTRLWNAGGQGVVLYVAPMKALINDQHESLLDRAA